jgi:peptidoglycan/LPS O-acetylase OafA/YrhL
LRFRVLDGWRGACALLVAAHHLEVHGGLYWQPLIRNAWLFVDFFFVLSGFVIAYAYGERLATGSQVGSFALRRFGRLWPLHMATLAMLVALELAHLAIDHWHPVTGAHAAFTADRSVIAMLANVFLVQALGIFPYETWNGPAWSISTEFATYLVFAALCFLVPHRRFRLTLSALLAAGGALVLLRFSRYGMRETFDWALARCLYGFFTGVLAYELWSVARLPRGTLAEIAMLAAVAVFITFVPGHFALEYLATPLFALAVLIFAGEGGLVSRAMMSRPAAALGRWSYSIYLVHTPVLAVLFSAVHVAELRFHHAWLIHLPDGNAILELGSRFADDLALLAYLAVVIGFAALTWRVIERPGQRLFNRLAAAKTPEIAAQIP